MLGMSPPIFKWFGDLKVLQKNLAMWLCCEKWPYKTPFSNEIFYFLLLNLTNSNGRLKDHIIFHKIPKKNLKKKTFPKFYAISKQSGISKMRNGLGHLQNTGPWLVPVQTSMFPKKFPFGFPTLGTLEFPILTEIQFFPIILFIHLSYSKEDHPWRAGVIGCQLKPYMYCKLLDSACSQSAWYPRTAYLAEIQWNMLEGHEQWNLSIEN